LVTKRATTGLLVLLLSAGGLPAQRYSFKYYGQEVALASLALALQQDRAGFLWIGTANGLYRYDGRQFRMFTKADGLPSMQAYSLAETSDGTLWVGTLYGLARRTGDRFEKVDMGKARGTRNIAADAQGGLWVASEIGLVAGRPSARSPSGWEFVLHANPGKSSPAFGVATDNSGSVWYGCGKSICLMKDGREVSLADRALPPDEYTGIAIDKKGNLWARSLTRLMELPHGAHRFVVQGQALAPAVRVGLVYVDSAGDLLVPTARGLACRTAGGVWRTIDRSNGLPSSATSVTFEDRERSLWIGIYGSGLVRWIGRRQWSGWTETEGLSHDIVWSIQRDAHGTLWAATESGLSRFVESADTPKRWERWPQLPLRTGRILALLPSPNGRLWVGRNPGGLVELDPRSGKMRRYGAETGLATDQILSLALDREGHIWACSKDGLFEGASTPEGVRFRRQRLTPGDTLPFTSGVHCDRKGRIWASNWYGVFVRESGVWRQFTTRDGLRQNGVTYMGEAADGAMWIAYREPLGVSRLLLENGKLTVRHFSHADGLYSDKPLFLGGDASGKFWMGTDRGVESFDGQRWTHYDRSDGLIWNDCNASAFFADSDGGIWIGTSRGISHFYGAGAPARPLSAPAVLTSVSLGNTRRPLSGPVTVPYSYRAFHATFAAMSFVNEESVRMRYRLMGLDSGWTETDDNDARYPDLRSGAYTFEVAAGTDRGSWGAPAQFSFQIEPPWWLRWWSWGAAAFLLYFLGRQLWAWRMRSVLHRQKALERAVEERTRELTLEQQRVLEQKQLAEKKRDVVEKQNVEIERLLRESEESARLKSEFLANISHEIRTPMNGIIGMTDLLIRSELQADQAECLRLVKVSADSLLSVINDVLDFSKIEAGRLDLDAMEFNPRELLRDTIKAMEVLAQNKSLALTFTCDDCVPSRLVGDPVRLRQLLINLVGNAIKFTGHGGVEAGMSATVHATGHDVELQVTVRDSGIGIPEEKQKMIFEPFRQADGSTSRRYGGTGLGLAICARLVELMGGRIQVKSRPGEGSTFSFTAKLKRPAQAKIDAAPGASPKTAEPVRPLRVLLAEDNPVNQKLATRILQAAGHTVVCAPDGQAAVEAMQDTTFDIVLMDVQMPRMDGFEATQEIRKLDAALRVHTPIVALTANAMKGDRERCIAAGMDGYVPKPLRAAELFAVMADLTPAAAGKD
jgi:signal transduction histidine kinase/ligand-binding sensor domain-containing protein/CheY-like chemotaxis protein